MQPAVLTAPVAKTGTWTGRALSGFIVLFLLFDATIHVLKPAVVVQAFAQLGVPEHLAVGIGVLELACVALYLLPRTSILGAVVLTGYLGGATAIQVRAGAGLFPVVFPSIVGALLWAGLVLRDKRLRVLIPGRT